ncbi:MAG: hypothetical protein HY778_17720 [Betaproteobacteria bacterium]|nr:hypothetical protein [Betaproteobacteria bacterium]
MLKIPALLVALMAMVWAPVHAADENGAVARTGAQAGGTSAGAAAAGGARAAGAVGRSATGQAAIATAAGASTAARIGKGVAAATAALGKGGNTTTAHHATTSHHGTVSHH